MISINMHFQLIMQSKFVQYATLLLDLFYYSMSVLHQLVYLDLDLDTLNKI